MSGSDAQGRTYRFGEFLLDLDRAALIRGDSDVKLRPKSFDVLRHLVQHAGRLVTKDELMAAVWGTTVVTDGSLTQCVIDIRRALHDDHQTIVRTVPRRGFVFELPVRQGPADADHPASETRLPDAAESPKAQSTRTARGWAAAATAVALAIVALAWWTRADRAAIDPGAAAVQPPPNSIAVLRFLDLSPTGDHAYFADGLAEEILHLLTQSPELRVTPRTSSFAFPPGKTDLRTIAQQLNVAHVLEGSVRRDDDQLRITAQLIDAATNLHVWSRTYERRFEDILAIQRDVATDVAAALKIGLDVSPTSLQPAAAEAHNLFLHGRYLYNRRGPGDLEVAIPYLMQAVELDPGHARAWTVLAAAYSARGWNELGDPTYRLEEQRAALERAIAIDPALAEAYVRMARYFSVRGDDEAGRAWLDRAIELAPDDPFVLFSRSNEAMQQGRIEEAVELQRRAVAKDPLSRTTRSNFALTLLAAGRYQEALAELRRAGQLGTSMALDVDTARTLLLLGDRDEARQRISAITSGLERDQLDVLLGDTPDPDPAWQRLRADDSLPGQIRLAEVAAWQGRHDEAFTILETIASDISTASTYFDVTRGREMIMWSPFLRLLREDPRWEGLIASLR